jgi:hypothetical protein
MVNPRKLVARVDRLSDISCYNDADFLISSGMEDDNDAGIEMTTDSCDIFHNNRCQGEDLCHIG